MHLKYMSHIETLFNDTLKVFDDYEYQEKSV